MSDYDGMTNQDVDPVDVWAEERDAELRLDAADEERALTAEKAQLADADDMPCGESGCYCRCQSRCGHACGCDCPHDEDCDCEDCMPVD